MSKYYCFVCDYDAKQKSNYVKHMNTKRHEILSTNCYPKVIQIMRKWITKWITILRLTILFFCYIFFYFCDYFRNAFFA